jgi:hypothetical protein
MAEPIGKISMIYYSGILNVGKFLENISSNYPHKKLQNNAILVFTNEAPRVIFEKITEKNTLSGNVVVISLGSYWGTFPPDILEWIKSKTPGIIVEDPKHNPLV